MCSSTVSAKRGKAPVCVRGKLEFEIRIWGRSVVGWRRLRSGGGRRDPLLLTALSLGLAVHPHLPPQLRSWLAATMLFVGLCKDRGPKRGVELGLNLELVLPKL